MMDSIWSKFIVIKDKKNKKLAAINAPITISELFAEPNQHKYGESTKSFKQHKDQNIVTRLTTHIAILAEVANKFHENKYMEKQNDGNFALKSQCQNCLTRISTPEFFFYTGTPLNEKEFASLLENITSIAGKCHENLHICLSSIPVLSKNGEVLNTVVYAECGADPKIHFFSKRIPSTVDVKYAEKPNYKQPQMEERSTISLLSVSKEGEIFVSHDSVIKSKLSGGAEFLITTDICLEHAFQIGRRALTEYIKRAAKFSELIPQRINHVITSNSIYLENRTLCGGHITHVDPSLQGVYSKDRQRLFKINKQAINLNESCADSLHSQFSTTSFSVKNGEVKVDNPPFGEGYQICSYQECQIQIQNDELSRCISEINRENITKSSIDVVANNELDRNYLETEVRKQKGSSNLERVIYKTNNLSAAELTQFLLITKNIDALEIKSHDLEKRGFQSDASIAKTTCEKLKDELIKFLYTDPQQRTANINEIIVKCTKIIDDADPTLSKHRENKKLIGNILLAIAGLGIIYCAAGLIKKASTGQFLFFNSPTHSSLKLRDIKKSIKNLPPTATLKIN